jgi:hypothetical protein
MERTVKNGLVISPEGVETWVKDGKLHREDGPAIVWKDGSVEWWHKGERHREDGPAYIGSKGIKIYYLFRLVYSKEEWWETISDESKMKAIFNGEGL